MMIVMRNVNDYSRMIMDCIINIEKNYLDVIRLHAKDFTRKRKIDVKHVFMQMFRHSGKSQKSEIYEFANEVGMDKNISTTAFMNARLKFNPEAVQVIMQDTLIEVYQKPDLMLKLNDYYICGVDGSDIVLPTPNGNREKFGTVHVVDTDNTPAMASISTMFDCINKIILDTQINEYKYSEISSASMHLETVKNKMLKGKKVLCIFDRGYSSIRLIGEITENGQFYLIRLKSNDFTKETGLLNPLNDDKWIDIVYDTARSNLYRDDKKFRQKLLSTTYSARFVRVEIEKSDGTTVIETLVTNLPNEDFDTDAIRECYHLRWDIETCYRSMKEYLKLEEFSGYREILIKQDIYCSAFVYNAISMIFNEQRGKKTIKEERYQYEMRPNRNFAVGIMKTHFIKMLVSYENQKLSIKAHKEFNELLTRHWCPVRPGRKYKRKTTSVNKSRMSYKYSY